MFCVGERNQREKQMNFLAENVKISNVKINGEEWRMDWIRKAIPVGQSCKCKVQHLLHNKQHYDVQLKMKKTSISINCSEV